jgi:hypothetical protein
VKSLCNRINCHGTPGAKQHLNKLLPSRPCTTPHPWPHHAGRLLASHILREPLRQLLHWRKTTLLRQCLTPSWFNSLSGFLLIRRGSLYTLAPTCDGCAVLRRYKLWRRPHDARAKHLEAFHWPSCITPLPYEAPTPNLRLSPPNWKGHSSVHPCSIRTAPGGLVNRDF